MKIKATSFPFRLALASMLILAAPAAAERLHFDHRLYPPLKAVFDNKREEMIYFNNTNPKYVVDRIAVQGKSADDWVEALNIISRTPSRTVKNADDWLAEIRMASEKTCPGTFKILARDQNSITFSQRATGCAGDKVQFSLYRIVAGKRSLFMLNAIYRDDMTEAMRRQWTELLNSARLEK
jgi:hypothetical protein